MSVEDYFEYTEVGRPVYCGWHYSLAGILVCSIRERQLNISLHSLLCSWLWMPCDQMLHAPAAFTF